MAFKGRCYCGPNLLSFLGIVTSLLFFYSVYISSQNAPKFRYKVPGPIQAFTKLIEPKTKWTTLHEKHTNTTDIPKSHPNCTEQRHVVYIRIPKTGSSTMTFVMWRFGLKRDLRFLLPRPAYLGSQSKLAINKFITPKHGKYCDLMANHVFYNYNNIKPYFPKDLVFISLLREPMKQLYSTIFFIDSIKSKIPGNDKVTTYLQNPQLYEQKKGRSFTHNPLASYLGITKKDFDNATKVQEKIKEIDQRFAAVLILERFEESLIVLKRTLCWTFKDIVYKVKNHNSNKPFQNISSLDYERLRKWSAADYLIYQYFEAKLDRQIGKGGQIFQNELLLFKKIQKQVQSYCRSSESVKSFLVEASDFSPEFKVRFEDCSLWDNKGLIVLKEIRNSQEHGDFCNRNALTT